MSEVTESRAAIDDLIDAGVVELSPFDIRADLFRKLGTSESGAKTAAIGR